MPMLRTLAGLALGPSLAMATLDWGAQAPPPDPRRAEVAVRFDEAGRAAAISLIRSTGSKGSDAVAREAALQLAGLQPTDLAAGHTLVFKVALADAG
jgi:hypothetical protein